MRFSLTLPGGLASCKNPASKIQKASGKLSQRDRQHHQPQAMPVTDPPGQNRDRIQHFRDRQRQTSYKHARKQPQQDIQNACRIFPERCASSPFLKQPKALLRKLRIHAHRQPVSVPSTTISSYKKIFLPVCVFPANLGTSPTESSTVNTPAETKIPDPSPTTPMSASRHIPASAIFSSPFLRPACPRRQTLRTPF